MNKPEDNTPGNIDRETPEYTPQVTPKVTFMRMDRETYEAFEQSVEQPYVGATTTESQVAFKLGVQHTLKVLRDGFVTGT